MILLSLVFPCYNEQEALRPFMEELSSVPSNLGEEDKPEVLMVNDGSSDNTLEVMRELAVQYNCVRSLSFFRNSGKERAMSAGFSAAKGGRTKWFAYENVERVAGETNCSFCNLFKYSLEGIVAFTTFLLANTSTLGMLFMLVSLAIIVAFCVRQLVWQNSVDGWTSMACIIVLLSGVQLFCVGIIGQYISTMYVEIKRRPHYIIDEQS